MISIGLDLSITHTGYAIVTESGLTHASGVIKSKPVGDLPVHETKRLIDISTRIIVKLDDIVPEGAKPLVVIEGLAFAAKNSTALTQLAGLNYLVRMLLVSFDWPFIIVAPTSLKKFITGSGKGDKDMIMMAIYKNYGFEASDNNEADAYGLAIVGLAAKGMPHTQLTIPQKEVVKLLTKQL